MRILPLGDPKCAAGRRARFERISGAKSARNDSGRLDETPLKHSAIRSRRNNEHELANTIFGSNGDKVLDGGGSKDTPVGGRGQRLAYSRLPVRCRRRRGRQGSLDRVFASTTGELAAGAEIEKLSTTGHIGHAGLKLQGNAFGNQIYGNAGTDTVSRADGHDVLVGMGAGERFFVYPPGDGSSIDTIADFDVADHVICLPQNCIVHLQFGAAAIDRKAALSAMTPPVRSPTTSTASGRGMAARQVATPGPALAPTEAKFVID